MKWTDLLKPKNPKVSVQTARGTGGLSSLLDRRPLRPPEAAVYEGLCYSVPVIDAALEKIICLAAGVTAEVDEDLAARKLTLSITGLGMFDTMSDAILEAERMLPAHLTIAFVLSGPNFNQHQGKGRTWQQIDDLDRMWKEIEAEG